MLLCFLDFIVIICSYYLAFILRFDGNIPAKYYTLFLHSLIVTVVVRIFSLLYFGTYKSIYKYAGIDDLITLVKAVSFSSLCIALSVLLYFNLHYPVGYPRSVFVVDWLLNMFVIGSMRFYHRIYHSLIKTIRFEGHNNLSCYGESQKRALILGAGDLGEMTLRGITNREKLNQKYNIIGFIDDDPAKRGLRIHGIEVLGAIKDLAKIVKDKKIEEIIISIPSLQGKKLRELMDKTDPALYSKIRLVPQLEEILRGKEINNLRGVQVEDLLGREGVEFDFNEQLPYLTGKRVLVTGAGGSIGSELCRNILKFHPSQLILFGRGEHSIFCIANELRNSRRNGYELKEVIGDVINKRKLEGVFKLYRPQVIFHAGADKHVPLMESNPDEAVLNNIVGTLNLLEIAEEFETERVVCISSDKAVNPSSVMGCCKRITELLVQSRPNQKTICAAVRFGNVLGSRGSVIPLFKEQIARGGPITITHPEITRFFMTIPEAAQLVIQAGAMGKGGEIFILDMGEPVKIVDLAKETIRLAGFEPGKDIAIDFIGLRPGEKLYEELAMKKEDVLKTNQNKIWMVCPNGTRYNTSLYKNIKELQVLSLKMEFEGIIKKLQEVVPEFHPPVHN
ncbi:MAG: polysaccharide biosynthesis protein [Candidatus Schekmanbacteria bacterium]|nr:polysaccharide biosynthesis protein [Candidatus Schekmanbacteria bacterium]